MMMLEQFYREDEADAVLEASLDLWVDTLEVLSQDAIKAGVIDYQRHGPRSGAGRLLKPAPGDLYAYAARFRPRPARPAPAPEPQVVVTPEARERMRALAAELGFQGPRPRLMPQTGLE